MYNIASEETYKDGEIILEEGSSGDWVYVILTGSVEISRMVGEKKFVIGVLQPGEVFGELGFFGGIRRTATSRAIGETTVGIIDRATLDSEFNKLSADFRSILAAVVNRFENSINRVCEFSVRGEARATKSLSLTFKDRQSFLKAYATNISPGGLFIKTERPFPQGEQFFLKLHLPGIWEPLKTNCEVVWARRSGDDERRPAGMGVRFREMSESDSRILQKYLKEVMQG